MYVKALVFLVGFLFLAAPAFSQNTKGDRPVGNQRQVRETKGKSIKRKERGRTKDIAGRRLRTKGRSSANRANANFPRPSTSSRRPARGEERSAAPRGRVFTRAPRESKSRAWKGDVSGYPMRRMKPSGADAARTNVYPQKGPYVRYAQRKPKEKPPVYKRTIKGKKFVTRRPQSKERAWKGGLQHEPVRNQSATGTIKNTYSQRGPYVSSYARRPKARAKVYSNRSEVSRVKRYTRPPATGGGQPGFFPSSRSKSYVQRGRKNVYWGKYQKKEQGVTTDLTGGPLRTRNYKSPTAGLVGRDSLQFFGRKPSGDRASRSAGGYPTATRSGRGWKGDVAGWPVRNPRKAQDRTQGHLRVTEPGIGALWLSKIFDKRFRGVKPKDRIPDTREARYQGNIPRTGSTKNFGEAGIGYSGNIKGGRGFSRAHAGYSGTMRRGGGFSKSGAGYSGNIRQRGRGFSGDYIGYSGDVPRGSLSEFSGKGLGYSGFLKRGQQPGMSKGGAGYSGNLRRGQGTGFSRAGAGYSGNIRRGQTTGFSRAGAGYSGNMKRGAGFSRNGANYSGNIKRGRGFNMEYAGYSGNIEHVGPIKQFSEAGVRYSGFMKRGDRGFSTQGAGYSGNVKRSSMIGFNREGPGYAGNIRSKRAPKGGGSISGLWNNDESPLGKTAPLTSGGADFSGWNKAKRPLKGGGSVSGILWNNEESPLGKAAPLTTGGADFSGRTKAKKPLKGGGTVSGKLWNNEESALAKNLPKSMGGVDFSGKTKAKRPLKGGGSVSGVLWNNNESALSKSPPDNAGAPSGLQVRVKQANYSRKEKANRDALPGIAPTHASVKASEYSRNMKLYWNYKHNPSSSRDAMKTIAPGKAEARIRDYQGNVRMRKYSGGGLHPDAKFAHSEEDNVKAERSFLTNVKVFWEKMFHKNGGQPSSVKDKPKKLQYDKREKGLWAY